MEGHGTLDRDRREDRARSLHVRFQPLFRSRSVESPRWPGLATVLGALVLYAVVLIVATYPTIETMGSRVPSVGDPAQHLGLLRWYRSCVLDGRSPLIRPEIQYPVGAPLGLFSPLHLQALLYVPMSLLLSGDVLCYNLIWMLGYLGTGLGTFALAWFVVRSRAAAVVAGLLAMLSGPMMIHGFGHLELIWLGSVPIFLMSWLRFIDEPGRARGLIAVASYLLVAMSAAYFALLVTVPAILYVAWSYGTAGHRADRTRWLRHRLAWLFGFVAMALPALSILFTAQIWAGWHGYSASRSRAEFDLYKAPLWGYVAPSSVHAIGRLLPVDLYVEAGQGPYAVETISYLGVVTIGLLMYAAASRVGFARSRFWWAAFGVVVLLSCGTSWTIGGIRIPLPCEWLWRYGVVFRLIRAPARFNLLAVVIGAVIAASGLKHLLGRFESRHVRAALCAGLVLVAVVDLKIVPYAFGKVTLPPMPESLGTLGRLDPGAAIVEVPQSPSAGSDLSALGGYWQFEHGLKTTAGYSGISNRLFDALMAETSPFLASQFSEPDALSRPDRMRFGLVSDVPFHDYAWLYLTAHDLRYVVVHHRSPVVSSMADSLDRLRALLADALILDDGTAAVFDRDRLEPPGGPIVLPTSGWGPELQVRDHHARDIRRAGHLFAYNPDPGRAVVLSITATADRHRRSAILRQDGVVVARWDVEPGPPRRFESPPLRFGGVAELVLACEGLFVSRVQLQAARETELSVRTVR